MREKLSDTTEELGHTTGKRGHATEKRGHTTKERGHATKELGHTTGKRSDTKKMQKHKNNEAINYYNHKNNLNLKQMKNFSRAISPLRGAGGLLLQLLLFCLFVFTKNSDAAIIPSLVPARTTGVAPLAVFFDASASTDTAYTSRPFHDLEYTWNFGDVNAGTWANGAQAGVNSKNTATGPVAAHVFETPGIYTVTLTVYNGTETVTKDTTITVDDPETVFSGTNTICFSNTNDFTGCPAGATQVTTSNFTTAINTYQATGKRLLFMRGDTFDVPSVYNNMLGYICARITADGPGTVGAFGTGALPIVQATVNGTIILSLYSSTTNIKDWRIMDLELDGSLIPNDDSLCFVWPLPFGTICNNVRGIAGGNQVTILRVSIHDMVTGISFAYQGLDDNNSYGQPGHVMLDQVAIVNSSVLHAKGGNNGIGVGLSGTRLSMMGNIVDDAKLARHVIRVFYLNKSIISNNTLSRQAPNSEIIKMHGPTWIPGSGNFTTDTLPRGVAGDAGGYTEQVILSDNKFVAGYNTDWTVGVGPQNATSDERLRNIIVERNWFVPSNRTQDALVINAVDVTVRNNIFNITSTTTGHRGVHVSLRGNGTVGKEPPPNDVHVYNNTFYSSSTGNFMGVYIDILSANTIVRNNLGYAPSATSPVMVSSAGTGTVQSNNSAVSPINQVKNTFPNWVSPNPFNPADYKLSDSSYAINTGVQVPGVFRDFSNTLRTGIPDMGAFEWKCYSPSAQTLALCAGQAVTVGVNTYTASGTYTDLLLTSSGCDSIVSTNLTVNSAVDTATSTSGTILTANAAGASYQWIDCNNANAAIAGATNQTYSATASGNYAVIVTQNSCSDTSSCITVNTTTTKEIISAKNVSVYPNPSNGQFKIELDLNAKAQIIICNTLGETIYKAQAQQGKQEINISDFANGIYILKVFNNEQQQYVRIVKQ